MLKSKSCTTEHHQTFHDEVGVTDGNLLKVKLISLLLDGSVCELLSVINPSLLRHKLIINNIITFTFSHKPLNVNSNSRWFIYIQSRRQDFPERKGWPKNKKKLRVSNKWRSPAPVLLCLQSIPEKFHFQVWFEWLGFNIYLSTISNYWSKYGFLQLLFIYLSCICQEFSEGMKIENILMGKPK